MGIQYINRQQKTYFLYQGKTKTGKPKYFFSMKTGGDPVDVIPEGFEIYENPNAQVFLRKIQPKLIAEDEIAIIEAGMEKYSTVERFIIDVKKGIISLFTPDQNVANISGMLTSTASEYGRDRQGIHALREAALSYSSDLRFILMDKQKRLFQTQRYCYLGRIDDWIDIGPVDGLETLVKNYVRHIGQESFYDLH